MSSPNPYEPPPIPEPESLPARRAASDDEYDGPPFRSPLLLAKICIFLQGLAMLSAIGEIYYLVHLYWLQNEFVPEDRIDDEATAVWVAWQGTIDLAGLLLPLTASVWLIAWMYRTHRNLEPLGHRKLDSKHIWAIVCWFVPVLNLFCPFQVMREIWVRSYPEGLKPLDSAPPVHSIFWWWLMRVAAVVTAYLGQLFYYYETWPQYYTFLRISFLGCACEFISAFLCILIVYRISQWQVASYQRLHESPVAS